MIVGISVETDTVSLFKFNIKLSKVDNTSTLLLRLAKKG